MHIIHVDMYTCASVLTSGVYRDGFWGWVTIKNTRNQKKHYYGMEWIDTDMGVNVDIAIKYRRIRMDKHSLYVYIDIYKREIYKERISPKRPKAVMDGSPTPAAYRGARG